MSAGAAFEVLDESAVVLFIQINREDIVILHAIFESYDGIGVVKTLDETKGVLCIIASPSTQGVCLELLDSLSEEIAWRVVERPENFEESLKYVVMSSKA